ncbi:hypothetical protein V5799_000129 [Amblyomma americanum]|uniref:Uncharacterized protein n=1 Tax=Amblyomma americanum TaxID=6943 RepID=A0AAQ4D3Y6_AMBAM
MLKVLYFRMILFHKKECRKVRRARRYLLLFCWTLASTQLLKSEAQNLQVNQKIITRISEDVCGFTAKLQPGQRHIKASKQEPFPTLKSSGQVA